MSGYSLDGLSIGVIYVEQISKTNSLIVEIRRVGQCLSSVPVPWHFASHVCSTDHIFVSCPLGLVVIED